MAERATRKRGAAKDAPAPQQVAEGSGVISTLAPEFTSGPVAEPTPEPGSATVPTTAPAVAAATPEQAPRAALEGPDRLVEDFRELRKEVNESRALTIKTHNMIGQLGADLKTLGKRQDRYERGLSLNSFVAYVLFTILLGG